MNADTSGATDRFYDLPTAAELIEAVREFMENTVIAETDGATRFHARVAANVLAIVERQLRADPSVIEEYEKGRAALGFDSDQALVAHLRAGGHDDPAVARLLRTAVAARLRVDNPILIGDNT